jgi:2-C-methyl-D-erythritol 2,4-cyclodiphosphate synthase
MPQYKTGLGQDSHRFLLEREKKACRIGGVLFEEVPGFDADSDGDVIYHALCNAITSITHIPIMGDLAIHLCHEKKITDSAVYVQEALKTLKKYKIVHVALTLEGKRPKFQPRVEAIRAQVAKLLQIPLEAVGLTATSGNELNACGRGEGVSCLCLLTVSRD